MILALPWLSLLLAGVSGYVLAWTGLEILADMAYGLAGYVRRRLRPRMIRQIMDLQLDRESLPSSQEDVLTTRNLFALAVASRPLWIAVGVCFALAVSDEIISPLLLLLIPVSAELYRTQVQRRRQQKIDEDVSNLVIQVEARYPLNRSLSRTLKEGLAALPDGVVSQALQVCIRKLDMNADTETALEPLRKLAHASLNRLTGVLVRAQDTRQEVFLDTLRLLREEVESRMQLRRHARRSLTIVFITTRVLQAVLVITFLVVGLFPAWRTYYTASPRNWLGMIVSLFVATAGSLYVELEMRALEGHRPSTGSGHR